MSISIPIERIKDPYMYLIYIKQVKEHVQEVENIDIKVVFEEMSKILNTLGIKFKIVIIQE